VSLMKAQLALSALGELRAGQSEQAAKGNEAVRAVRADAVFHVDGFSFDRARGERGCDADLALYLPDGR
jgi:hypothetical protein